MPARGRQKRHLWKNEEDADNSAITESRLPDRTYGTVGTMKRRLGLALVVAAALGGLAAGVVIGHRDSGSALAQSTPHVLAQGTFHAVTWNTGGTATLVRDASGELRLRLSREFVTKRAPELYVYLAVLRGRQKVYWKQVAPLKSPRGAQTYPVSSYPASSSGLEVAIYCGECNQINAVAPLAPVTQS